MFQLKDYQERAVQVVTRFLAGCREGAVEHAFENVLMEQGMEVLPYRDFGLEQTPYACLRIPTGGGKTVLGSHAVEVAAREYLQTSTPIALWLVPTTTIRQQTVTALKTPGHPYRLNLDKAFSKEVLVLDIDEVTQIRPQDISGKAIVVVSTLANLRVTDTSGRKVYAHNENFEPHFAKVPVNHPSYSMLERVTQEDLKENGLTEADLGKVKFSFANLLAIHKPVVIVDEAHNARTSLTFETLRRVHPGVVIELTATPNITNTNGSNVLFHVSAAELKAEEMIKLPIILTEQQTWQDAIRDAVITRNKLALDAQNDEDYIRPIALFQAESKNATVTVEVLKEHLIEQLKVEEHKIAIATGTQRELDDLNLFDPACPIEYIITIEALKEGWDCSFAYVFCSVKQVSSSKDAEQLLGRVLRMPYARRRVIEDLNRAYAHLLADSKFSKTANALKDTLISMGFEEMEVAAYLREQPAGPQGDLFGGAGQQDYTPPAPAVPALVVELEQFPSLDGLSEDEKRQVSMARDEQSQTTVVRVTGNVSPALADVLLQQTKPGKNQKKLEQEIQFHNHAVDAAKAPSELGAKFRPLPQVCMLQQGELELVESEALLSAVSWNLMDYQAELKGFALNETTDSFLIDTDGKRMTYGLASQTEVVQYNEGFLDLTEQDLLRWLDRELRSPAVQQKQLVPFVALVVKRLLQKPENSLTALVRNKFKLARDIAELIANYRRQAQASGYQAGLFDNDNSACLSDEFQYEFQPDKYPSRPPYYRGSFQFKKHFFPQNLIEDLKSTGEEFECAQAIESIPQVEYWIRNLVRREHASFWLPLAHGRFFPDFVCQLTDGRMLVVEYKGEAYVSNDDSAEKRAIGEKWAELSQGRCLFIMAVMKDDFGRGIRDQILAAIQA